MDQALSDVFFISAGCHRLGPSCAPLSDSPFNPHVWHSQLTNGVAETKEGAERIVGSFFELWRLIIRRGFLLPWRFSLGRPRPTTKTCGRNFKLAFECPVKSGFGLIADFRCDLCN